MLFYTPKEEAENLIVRKNTPILTQEYMRILNSLL